MSTTLENKELRDTILLSLERQFSPAIAITRTQFREVFPISRSTDNRMYMSKEYPRTIKVRGEERILLAELAAFLADRPDGRTLARPYPGSRSKSQHQQEQATE